MFSARGSQIERTAFKWASSRSNFAISIRRTLEASVRGRLGRAALVSHHVFEDAVFLGREIDGLALTRDLAAESVEHEIADLQLFRRGLTAAEQRTHARQQLDKRERFGEVIVSAQFEAAYAIVYGSACAEDQDRRTGFAGANAFEHLHAIHIRQHQIENDDVIIGLLDEGDRRVAGVRDIERIAITFEAALEKIRDLLFVLDYQNPHWF